MPKTSNEVQDFMNRERLASFVTISPGNKPHVVPVFFTYEDGKIYIQSDRNSVKIRNLLRNSNVAVAVYSREEVVIINGEGQIIESNEEFIKRTKSHINKYKLRLDKYGRDSLRIPLFDQKIRCVVEVTPKRTIFW